MKSHVKIRPVMVSVFDINTKIPFVLQQSQIQQLKLDQTNIQKNDHLCLFQFYNIRHNQKFEWMPVMGERILLCSRTLIILLQLLVGLRVVFECASPNASENIHGCITSNQWIHTKMFLKILRKDVWFRHWYKIFCGNQGK